MTINVLCDNYKMKTEFAPILLQKTMYHRSIDNSAILLQRCSNNSKCKICLLLV